MLISIYLDRFFWRWITTVSLIMVTRVPGVGRGEIILGGLMIYTIRLQQNYTYLSLDTTADDQ